MRQMDVLLCGQLQCVRCQDLDQIYTTTITSSSFIFMFVSIVKGLLKHSLGPPRLIDRGPHINASDIFSGGPDACDLVLSHTVGYGHPGPRTLSRLYENGLGLAGHLKLIL
jgi:hypothetical protein